MKKRTILCGALVLFSCGCSHMSHTDAGVLGGGALGAGTGAVIGHALGDTAAGAVLGGVVGAVAGGVTGNAIDNAERRAEDRAVQRVQAQQAYQAAQRPPLTMGDIIGMTHNHISDDIIINEIRQTGSVFTLTAQDIIALKQQGVSDRVVMEMQTRRVAQPSTVVVSPPVRREVTVIHHAPPPPVIGVGFGFSRHGHWHHRCW